MTALMVEVSVEVRHARFGDWYNGSTPGLGPEGGSSTLPSPTKRFTISVKWFNSTVREVRLLEVLETRRWLVTRGRRRIVVPFFDFSQMEGWQSG